MADEEQLHRLRQGVEAWNAWRQQAEGIDVDLRHADLREADLERVNLAGADLRGANLGAANLRYSNLFRAALVRAIVTGANLGLAELSQTAFEEADLTGADFAGADLSEADFSDANLTDARVTFATLRETRLRKTVCSGAIFRETVLANVDLSNCVGLESCVHRGPSPIDIRTLQRSGRLPLAFLRGVGLPEKLIDYLPSLLDQAIQFYSCFISYSTKDEEFARRLHADLQDKGVRCWFSPEDLKIGDKILDTLDEAIRLRDKVLLVLSEASIASGWVEDEVTKTFAEERRRGVTVMFPVRIDYAVFTTNKAWAIKLRDSRHIGDFRTWKDHDAYQHTLERLLRDLRVEAT